MTQVGPGAFQFPLVPALLFSIALALEVFSGNSQLLGLPIGLDRIVMMAAALLFAVHLSSRAREVWQLLKQPKSMLLLVLMVIGLASSAWAGTLFEPDGFFALLDRYGLIPFLVFVFAPVLFADPRARNYLLIALVITGGYLGTTALFEITGHTQWVFPSYIGNPDVGMHWGRARGPFLEATGNGFALISCGVAAVLASRLWIEPWQRRTARIVAVLCLLGALFTLTRSVWLGAMAAIVIGLVYSSKTRRFLLPALAGAGVLVVVALAVIPGLGDRIGSRSSSQEPVWDRNNTNAAALRVIGDKPLTGIGFRNFRTSSEPYLWQADSYPLTGSNLEVHNVFLSRLAELGLLGGALWITGLVVCVGGALMVPVAPEFKGWQQGLAALVVAWFLIASLSPASASMTNLILWTWAGIVTSGAIAPKPLHTTRFVPIMGSRVSV